jgi:fatty acid-binding protein DegV
MRSKHHPDTLQTNYETWCQRWEFALKAGKDAVRYRWNF